MTALLALLRQCLAGLRVLLAAVVVCGLGYPLLTLGIAQVAMPWHADGSLVTASGEHTTDRSAAAGSALLGQRVEDPRLFLPRASAAGDGYDPAASGGSNLGPESRDLVDAIEDRRAEVAARETVAPGDVPPDAVTASASGLDPHISPAYAALQVPRVARANGLSEQEVRSLVAEHTSGRTLGVLGEARVDVLLLNIDVRRVAAG